MRELRFLKRNARSRRKANRTGLIVVFRRPRPPRHAVGAGDFPALPPASSMKQRTVELPKLPPRTAYVPSVAEARVSAQHVVEATAVQRRFESQFRLEDGVPLFRDEAALMEYEDRYQARLRQIQRIPTRDRADTAWSDGRGVNLGSDQSPKTITWSTTAYREFAGSRDPKQVSR